MKKLQKFQVLPTVKYIAVTALVCSWSAGLLADSLVNLAEKLRAVPNFEVVKKVLSEERKRQVFFVSGR